ncbi:MULTISPECIES: DUF6559 family protein [Thalassotalea]|uniref:DUF6559 family protein n=1 Tax=Thalassotalea TaxID=1518149 RepID=UPI0009449FA0|nr:MULTISPECIES: DUF6559 family protein [Thalassotalea]OKY27937.1 hypothetical protein BI291_06940 [Thalassotalea sp. PP2-459]
MFKYWSIKKYGSKLLPLLEKQYGVQDAYTASQIRTVVYQKDFNPEYLPLGYILFLDQNDLNTVLDKEFPSLNVAEYKKEILTYLEQKSYRGFLQILQ